ncbi:hypothetical protein ACLK2H_04300 [Escherichia coli]
MLIGKVTTKLGELIDALKQTLTVVTSAGNTCTLPTPKKNVGFSSVLKRGMPPCSAEEKTRFLSELTAAEGLER